MENNDTIYFVFYLDIRYVSNIDDEIEKVSKSIMANAAENEKWIILPRHDVTEVICVNPRYISDESLQKEMLEKINEVYIDYNNGRINSKTEES